MSSTQAESIERVAKQLRLTLTKQEWHLLRVMAAEHDTSMQALVATTMSNTITKHLRETAAQGAIKKGGA